MKKNNNQVKSNIVSAAWELYYRFGYENTTIDDIVHRAHVSKGSFYYYFSTKADLLESLSYLFDRKYEELMESMPGDLKPVEKLLLLNRELLIMIENTVPVSLLSQLFVSQLSAKGERHLLNPERSYFKVIRQVVLEGKEEGIFLDELTVNDITRSYAMFERALLYDWCLFNGNYSLYQYSRQQLKLFLNGMTKKDV